MLKKVWQEDDLGGKISHQLRDIADLALFEGSKPGTRAYIPVLSVAVLGLGCHHDHPYLLAMFAIAWILAGLVRWWVPRQAIKRRLEDPDLWRSRFRWSILPTAIIWGVFSMFVMVTYGIGWRSVICIFVAGGLTTGATAAFNLDRKLHGRYVLSAWLPLLMGHLSHVGKASGAVPLLIVTFFFMLYLIRLGREQGERYWRGLRDRLFITQLAEFTSSLVPLVGVEELPHKLEQALEPLINFSRAWTGPGEEPSNDPTLSVSLGTTVGGQLFFHLAGPVPFTAQDRHILDAFASPAGNALDRSRLFNEVQRMARYDFLTNVANRAHFFESAREVLGVSRRLDDKSGHQTKHSVILLDIDHFKSVNDVHGHDVGDEVLKGVATCCQKSLREVDVFARYGGEEFAVFLPGANQSEAALLTAERLRKAVSDLKFSVPSGPISVTISLGVAQVAPKESLTDTLKRADEALYECKRSGRNQVQAAPLRE